MRKFTSVAGIVALLALSAVPVAASTGGGAGTDSGATIRITGAHVLANVAVVVDVAVTCQPINGNTQLTLGYGAGMTDLSVTVTERVGKTVASAGGTFDGSNTTITCDGTTISHYKIDVVPAAGTVPFTRGAAVMDATTFIQDLTVCCSGPIDQGDTGLTAVKITH